MVVGLLRLRFAAGVCVLATGLLIGGGAVAVADPGSSGPAAHGDNGTNASGQPKKPKDDPGGTDTKDEKKDPSGTDTKDEKKDPSGTDTKDEKKDTKDEKKDSLSVAPAPLRSRRPPLRSRRPPLRSRRFLTSLRRFRDTCSPRLPVGSSRSRNCRR
jgi:hypothetical protein